jgi:cobalt-zinc-cadmium efflux system protein
MMDFAFTFSWRKTTARISVITTLILLVGSIAVTVNAVHKIIEPTEIHYNGMILFAVIGAAVNFLAAFFTHGGESLNQKAVNLHMLEDVLGWIVVLIGAIVMRFTDFALIDPIMSIGVAVFIFVNAVGNLKEAVDLFLEKAPRNVQVSEIGDHLKEIDGVLDVHHIHLWSMDGHNNYATMHIVTNADQHEIKEKVREELEEHGIGHATLELETQGEHCHHVHCHVQFCEHSGHHHYHQH